jgi:L,D-transpeptidase ErfK/SrfK
MNTYLARACLGALSVLSFLFVATPAVATTYTTPSTGNTLIGNRESVTSNAGDTLVTIAQHFDIGLNGIIDANPGVNPVNPLPEGQHIVIPTAYLIPPLAREGIIINLPEMRLYYFPQDGKVMTFPIGIGKIGKTIPITRTAIARKITNPIWIPPEDIRQYNAEKGVILPAVMPAGPDNPLGPYAIYLRLPTYLIHSTIFPDSVGRRASFGCIRMHESDIKEFFPIVTAGIPVTIIDMPNKVGWQENELYVETHEPLEERSNEPSANNLIASIDETIGYTVTLVNWQLVSYLAEDRDGMPHEIGFRVTKE